MLHNFHNASTCEAHKSTSSYKTPVVRHKLFGTSLNCLPAPEYELPLQIRSANSRNGSLGPRDLSPRARQTTDCSVRPAMSLKWALLSGRYWLARRMG